jgi:hypothetical protein
VNRDFYKIKHEAIANINPVTSRLTLQQQGFISCSQCWRFRRRTSARSTHCSSRDIRK